VLAKIGSAVNQALADSEVKDKLARLGIEPVGGTAQEFARMASQDAAKWKQIIAERKISAD
jgi:tripartite-type tricarboxylate transporter receptor subunit TctC